MVEDYYSQEINKVIDEKTEINIQMKDLRKQGKTAEVRKLISKRRNLQTKLGRLKFRQKNIGGRIHCFICNKPFIEVGRDIHLPVCQECRGKLIDGEIVGPIIKGEVMGGMTWEIKNHRFKKGE